MAWGERTRCDPRRGRSHEAQRISSRRVGDESLFNYLHHYRHTIAGIQLPTLLYLRYWQVAVLYKYLRVLSTQRIVAGPIMSLTRAVFRFSLEAPSVPKAVPLLALTSRRSGHFR